MTNAQVIRWWEWRRLVYNLALLIIGITSIAGMEWLMNSVVPPGEDAVEPFVLILGIVLYGLLANLCYTLGWLIEMRDRVRDPVLARQRGIRRFRTGTILSCSLTALPFWAAFVIWVMHRIKSR